jgi:WD40 repeat protein
MRTIKPLTNGVYALAVSSDGNFVAGGGGDGTVKIWNIHSGALQQSIAAHSGRVLDLHYNAAGTMLASAGADATVRIWNTAGGALQTNFTGHSDSATAVRFSPNGASVASGGKDNTVRLWDAASGTQQWNRSFASVRINDLTFAADGNSIAVGQTMTFGNPIVVLNAMNGDTATFFNRLGSSSNALEYSPNGVSLVSSGDDGHLSTFHLVRPFIYSYVPASSASIRSLSYFSNASMLVTGSSNGTISVWSILNRWQKFTP